MPSYSLADLLLAQQGGGAFGTQTPEEAGTRADVLQRLSNYPQWFIHAMRGAISGTNPVQTDEPGWWGGQSIQGNQINKWGLLPPEKVVPDLGPESGWVITPEEASRRTMHPSFGQPESYGAGRYKLYTNPYGPMDALNLVPKEMLP